MPSSHPTPTLIQRVKHVCNISHTGTRYLVTFKTLKKKNCLLPVVSRGGPELGFRGNIPDLLPR